MKLEQFFSLFIKELESKPEWWSYYKYHSDVKSFEFRKAYFMQRLAYIEKAIRNKESITWDIGCGYGTTAIFLVLNGYKVHGTTLEFYFKEIPERIKYWSQFGDLSGFTYDYEDLFDESKNNQQFDFVIVQDTLHHLEPLDKALQIINSRLKTSGEMVVIEENGSNLMQRFKLYLQRGNKRIIEIYDERLKKNILLGNENIRSLSTWRKAMSQNGFFIDDASVQYVRAFPPFIFNKYSSNEAVEKEQNLWKSNGIAKEYFFFGINFIAQPIVKSKSKSESAINTENVRR